MPADNGSTELQFKQLIYDHPAPHIARITMNRPERRNAQGNVMTYELDAAFTHAARDPDVKVIILSGAGPDFSSGHDLSLTESNNPDDFNPVGNWAEFTADGWEGDYSREREVYFDMVERWRNLPKPTIAQVQGRCILGGVMLAFACDLIVAADDARFKDHAAEMGMPHGEFPAHSFEVGVRKAKEWLWTADWLSADDAWRCGMVNHVVPAARLEAFTLELATKIADKPLFALKLIKESVNASQDAAGRRAGMQTAFTIHQLSHAHNMIKHGFSSDISRVDPKLKRKLESMKGGWTQSGGS